MSKVSSTCHIALGRALEQLETVMEQEGVWPKKMPAEQDLNNAMESAVPFAVDFLAFESWLAFIFIPKMRILSKQETPLPPMQITPAAEIYLSSAHQRTLSQLQVIDNIANEDIG
ncbi:MULTISPECIES: YqcC family protein [Alteromonas]|uniref:YqcC family protein n=1 Tax=Alteromonas TaxID=226 RepID=UPI00314011A6